jgi:hypothetical protein
MKTIIKFFVVAAMSAACQSSESPSDPPDEPPSLPLGHRHGFDMHWATADDMAGLTADSDVVAHGRIVGVNNDALRVYPYSEQLGRELTEAESSGSHDDTYVKLYTLEIDDLVNASAGVLDAAGHPIGAGSRIVVAELGGKRPCGCEPAPNESPIQHVGDEVFYFVKRLARAPIGRASTTGLFQVAGGYQGRIPTFAGLIHPMSINGDPDNFLVKHEMRPVGDLIAEVRLLRVRDQRSVLTR